MITNKMRVLVTGSNGQLGREMRRVSDGSCLEYIFTDHAELDITNYTAVSEIVTANSVDVIINCAAYTNVEQAELEIDKATILNSDAVGNLADVARECGATLIHISTDYVFDGQASSPYSELSETNPVGVYGKTKVAGEQRIIDSGCNYIILRTSWLYSKWGNNFVKRIQELAEERDRLSVVSDQVGSPTYAWDLAWAINHIVESGGLDNCGLYHFSDEGVCSWFEFAVAIVQLSGSSCEVVPISSDDYPSKVPRPHYSVLSKEKIKATFDLEIPSWGESLRRHINDLKD